MKKTAFILIGILMMLSVPTMAQAAADAKPQTIAVIDMRAILNQSKAAKSIQQQLESQQKKYQGQITKQEEELRSAEQELIKQRPTISPEDFATKRAEFEKKVIAAQKLVQQRKRSLDIALNEAMNVLKDKTAKIIADMADSEDISIVLPRANVVMAKKALDITKPVLEKLDKTLKTVPVKWSDKS